MGLRTTKTGIAKAIIQQSNYYKEKAVELYQFFQLINIVSFQTNAGLGKSRTVGEFSKLLEGELFQRMVFATNTRKNRDEFVQNNPHFIAIKGNGEIIDSIANNPSAETQYNSYFSKFSKSQLDEKDLLFELYKDQYINPNEYLKIKGVIEEQKELMGSKYIALTTAKMQVGEILKSIKDAFVFIDEMNQSKLLTAYNQYYLWGNEFTSYVDPKLNAFTKQLIKQVHKGRVLGLCLLSAEKSLTSAMESPHFPIFNKGIRLKSGVKSYRFEEPHQVWDDNLKIVIVDSTSNNDKKSIRNEYAILGRSFGYEIICNGKLQFDTTTKKKGEPIGDYTIESIKGDNNLKDKHLMTILSVPTPSEIAPLMAVNGVNGFGVQQPCFVLKKVDDYSNEFIFYSPDTPLLWSTPLIDEYRLTREVNKAKATIVSDNANQAIGRNTGYRAHPNAKHVLIVPKQLEDLVELDTLGEVFDCSTKEAMGEIQDPEILAIFGFAKNDPKVKCKTIVDDVLASFNKRASTSAIKAVALKKQIEKLFEKYQVSSDDIERAKIDGKRLLKWCLSEIENNGFQCKKIDRKIEGEKFKCQVYFSSDLKPKDITEVLSH